MNIDENAPINVRGTLLKHAFHKPPILKTIATPTHASMAIVIVLKSVGTDASEHYVNDIR